MNTIRATIRVHDILSSVLETRPPVNVESNVVFSGTTELWGQANKSPLSGLYTWKKHVDFCETKDREPPKLSVEVEYLWAHHHPIYVFMNSTERITNEKLQVSSLSPPVSL